jgi:hypothetical protein
MLDLNVHNKYLDLDFQILVTIIGSALMKIFDLALQSEPV